MGEASRKTCQACDAPPDPGHAPFCASCHDAVQHLYQLWDDAHSCGCGWPGDAFNLVRDLLALTPFYEHRDEVTARVGVTEAVRGDGDCGVLQLVLGALDAARFIDHGTSIFGSWITPKGRLFLDLAQRFGFSAIEMAGFPHDGCGCTPDCPYWRVVREDWEAEAESGVLRKQPPIPNALAGCECERVAGDAPKKNRVVVTRTGWRGDILDSYALSTGCPWHGARAQDIAADAMRAFGPDPEAPRHTHAPADGEA